MNSGTVLMAPHNTTLKAEDNRTSNRTLFIVATYTIGKEKVLLRIAEVCGCKIVVDVRIFRCMVIFVGPGCTIVGIVKTDLWLYLLWMDSRPDTGLKKE